MDRRSILTGVGGLAVGAAAGLAAASKPESPATEGPAAPAIVRKTYDWRMVTTWPENFPGLGTGAVRLASMIEAMSEGRLKITVYGAGKIVPAFEAMEAVATGTAQMGHGAPYYWKGKVPASQFLAATPFGLTAPEQNAWLEHGGGQELADKVYRELGCKFFASGNSGMQMGGWFNKEIKDINDLKGLKMRMPGLGGEVLKAAGGVVVNLPGGEILPALQQGTIDATEWVGPYNDLAMGLYESAQYYYYPGWHEPATILENFVNLEAWDSLPADLQAIVREANRAVNLSVYAEFTALNESALSALVNDHGVDLRGFPDDVMSRLAALSKAVLADIAAADPLSQEVHDSLMDFRKRMITYGKVAETTYLPARMRDA